MTGKIRLEINRYLKEFEIPENINHYSKQDYYTARRKYVKWRYDSVRGKE